MKFYKKRIGIITLTSPVSINEDELKQYYGEKFESTDDCVKIAGFNDSYFSKSPYIADAKMLFANKTTDGYTTFASNLSLKELAREIDNLPADLGIHTQLETLFKMLFQLLEERADVDEKEKELFEQYLSELAQLENGLESLNSKPISFTGYLTSQEAVKVRLAPEHTYRVESFMDFADLYVGTSGLGTCLFLVAVNPVQCKIAVAHLDEGTIEKYVSSVDNLFYRTVDTSTEKINVFLLGGVDNNYHNDMADFRTSKTLVYSVINYIKEKPNLNLAGTFLFPIDDDLSAFVVKANRLQGINFLRVAKGEERILDKKSIELLDSQDIIGSPLNYRELIRIKNPDELEHVYGTPVNYFKDDVDTETRQISKQSSNIPDKPKKQ